MCGFMYARVGEIISVTCTRKLLCVAWNLTRRVEVTYAVGDIPGRFYLFPILTVTVPPAIGYRLASTSCQEHRYSSRTQPNQSRRKIVTYYDFVSTAKD